MHNGNPYFKSDIKYNSKLKYKEIEGRIDLFGPILLDDISIPVMGNGYYLLELVVEYKNEKILVDALKLQINEKNIFSFMAASHASLEFSSQGVEIR